VARVPAAFGASAPSNGASGALSLFGKGGAYLALQEARQRERTDDFIKAYARRAGIEGTLSRGIRTCEMRCTRYSGLVRVRLGHLLTAVALNFLRLGEWFADVPRAKTRTSPFTLLMADVIAT
jgi:transposase